MIKSVFHAVQRGVESNKQSFLKLKEIDNVDVSGKWSVCVSLMNPVQVQALAENRISLEDFNKLYNREYRKMFLDAYSKVIDYSFGYKDIHLMTNDAVKLVSELFLKDLASKELKDFVKELSAKNCGEQEKMIGFQKYLVALQMSHLRHFKRNHPQGWLELMLSFQLFSISHNRKYVEKLMKQQEKLLNNIHQSL